MKKIFKILLFVFAAVIISCQDEPVAEDIINRNMVDEELFNFLQSTAGSDDLSIDCIKFNYSFTVFEFDTAGEIVRATAIFDDFQFVQFLDNVPENNTISINYPIAGTLENGEVVNIETNEQLKEAIQRCAKEEYQIRCNNTLKDCNWKVVPVDDEPNDYEGSVYSLKSSGKVEFHHQSNVYFGTWVTLYIGDVLYLNIDLNDDEDIETFWDANWTIELRTLNDIYLENDGTNVALKKDCSLDCNSSTLRACEADDTPGQAVFNFLSYTSCFEIPFGHNALEAITHNFYETEMDALEAINPISNTEYTNTTNPQTIFVRTAYIETQELLQIKEITLEVAPCPEG
ncbi:MAG: hypothetical protein ACSHW7_12835 [Patiriisocius sp.]|uniref:hypothetical protein n=1 Tax=Patiriisocius sp. TaxID=2822396 RepID=UPI003EF15B0D